jgi:hypothetical protein
MDVEILISRYPKLYHMAEHGSWPQIKRRGLLSTTALLDLYGYKGKERSQLERKHRPISVTLESIKLGPCVLRDQRPMPPSRLRKCLPQRISATAWYKLLNGKVFFWTSRARLLGLLNAHNYRGKRHDVLIVDTEKLVRAHVGQIELCHINSGNTFPYLHKKSAGIFKEIADYPTNTKGKPRPEVAELVVSYAVPKIARYVLDVRSRTSKTDYGSIL